MTVKVNPVLMGVVEGADEAPSWDASAARKKKMLRHMLKLLLRGKL